MIEAAASHGRRRDAPMPAPPPLSGTSCTASKSTTDLVVVEIARSSLLRACARSRWAWKTKKLVDDAGRELLLLGFEPPLGQLARRARRLHALLVGLHLARRLAHLRRDLQLAGLQLRLRLVVLQPGPGEVRFGVLVPIG